MKKFCLVMISLFFMFTMVSCGPKYEVILSMGDGRVEDDNVTVAYDIHEKLKDGYVLKGKMIAEKNANMALDYYFTISFDDPLSSSNYSEKVLFSVKGADFEKEKTSNGYGPIKFEIKLEKLESYFEKTDTEKQVYLVIHGSEWNKSDITTYNSSRYTYKWNNGKVELTK